MRNLFLTLVLANLLLLAWQVWVDPSSPATAGGEVEGLALYGGGRAAVAPPSPGGQADPAARADVPATAIATGACFRLGPLTDYTAAQQAARSLAARGIDATPIARDAQLWLGHWVQISGFASLPEAESARDRLVAGGIADALLMQDGPQPLISLGVFRDPDRADRVASAARQLGFEVGIRDRYRPGVEQWLVIRPRAGQSLMPADLGLAGDRIMRTEPAPCGDAGGDAGEDAGGAATAGESGPAGLGVAPGGPGPPD